MARKKKEETPISNTTDIQIPESGLIEDTPKESGGSDDNTPTFQDEARAAIFANRRKLLEEQSGLAETGVTVTEPIIENAAEGATPETAPEGSSSSPSAPIAETQPVAEPTAASPSPEKYTIIVNGQPTEYTLDELKQQAQLGVGARQKFDEAARLRQEAQQLMFSASQQHSQPQSGNNQQAPQQLPDIPEKELRDIAKRLNYGSEDEQVKALKEAGILFTKAAGQPNQLIPPEVLVREATQNALNAITIQQEQEILKNEFKDIISDPALAYATDFMVNQLAQKYTALGEQKTRLELLREAGNMAKERYLKPAPQNQPNSSVTPAPVVVDMTNKIERKRTAPQPPTSANRTATNDANPYGVPSIQALDAARTKAFQDIAKRRGQA